MLRLALAALALLPLTPPLAPVARASEPVAIDTLPFVIDRPGRYVLARDILSPVDETALRIHASDVLVDLGGHRLIGQSGTLGGVVADAGLERIELRDGGVIRFGLDGVDLSGVTGARLTRIDLLDNGGHGAALGDEAVVSEVHAEFNHGGLGLYAGARASLRDVLARNNQYGGLRAGPESVLTNCSGVLGTYGHGLRVGAGSLLRGCVASENLLGGIEVDPGSTLLRCSAEGNLAFGLRVGARSLALECEASGTLDGPGIELDAGATADACSARGNRGAGIAAAAGSVVRGCTSRANDGPGIAAAGALLVVDNDCEGSIEADGLLVTGRGTTLRGNSATGNAGLDLRALGEAHVVVGNRARRGRFEVAPGSLVGPLADRASDDPLANVLTGE